MYTVTLQILKGKHFIIVNLFEESIHLCQIVGLSLQFQKNRPSTSSHNTFPGSAATFSTSTFAASAATFLSSAPNLSCQAARRLFWCGSDCSYLRDNFSWIGAIFSWLRGEIFWLTDWRLLFLALHRLFLSRRRLFVAAPSTTSTFLPWHRLSLASRKFFWLDGDFSC